MPWCTACVSAVMIVVSWPPPCVAVLVQNVICTDKRTHETHAWRVSVDAWGAWCPQADAGVSTAHLLRRAGGTCQRMRQYAVGSV